MFDALVLTAALVLPPEPGSQSTTTVASHSASDRQWAVTRPQRGTTRTTRIVLRAATFPRHIAGFASCVVRRESGGNLTERQSGVQARNPSGAQGRWQFMPPWNHGGPFMVADRLVDFGMPKKQAREVRKHLSSIPIWRWNGWWQDILFIEAMDRGGKHHWHGPGC